MPRADHDTQILCLSLHMYFYHLSFWEILGCSRFWIIITRSFFGARTPLTLAHALFLEILRLLIRAFNWHLVNVPMRDFATDEDFISIISAP